MRWSPEYRNARLASGYQKSWLDWMRQIRPSQIPYLTRVLARTQRMIKPQAYLKEHEEAQCVSPVAPAQAIAAS